MWLFVYVPFAYIAHYVVWSHTLLACKSLGLKVHDGDKSSIRDIHSRVYIENEIKRPECHM